MCNKTLEINVEVPNGYMIDEENSTFSCIKFKPKKLSYKDIAKELFKGNLVYYIDSWGGVVLNQ